MGDDWNTPNTDDRVLPSSPQNAAFELRIGKYLPEVDGGVEDGAFAQVFGNDDRYIIGFEVDWQFLRVGQFASLGAGFGLSYTKLGGSGIGETGEPTSEENTFSLYPMSLVGVLRVDFLARETPVPLVPYGKAGLGYAIWRVTDDRGVLHSEEGIVASDVSYGTHLALGLMFLLDPFDATAAVQIDENSGINNSYVFAEYTMRDLDGFDSSQMQVGDSSWIFGLALEM